MEIILAAVKDAVVEFFTTFRGEHLEAYQDTGVCYVTCSREEKKYMFSTWMIGEQFHYYLLVDFVQILASPKIGEIFAKLRTLMM